MEIVKLKTKNGDTPYEIISSEEFINYIRIYDTKLFSNYEITDELIISYLENFQKEVLFGQTLSESVVLYMDSVGYLNAEHFEMFTMTTYCNFSGSTLYKFRDLLDLNKLLTFKIANDSLDLSDIHIFIDSKTTKSTWDIISTCDLSKEFLRENVKNINWYIFLKTNIISDDIIEEFSDIIDAITTLPIHNEQEAYTDSIMAIVDTKVDVFDELINNMNNNI